MSKASAVHIATGSLLFVTFLRPNGQNTSQFLLVRLFHTPSFFFSFHIAIPTLRNILLQNQCSLADLKFSLVISYCSIFLLVSRFSRYTMIRTTDDSHAQHSNKEQKKEKNSMNHSPSINNKIHRLLIDTARTIMRTINLRFADVSVRLSASLALLHKQTAQMQQQKITKASGLEYGESTRYRQCDKKRGNKDGKEILFGLQTSS